MQPMRRFKEHKPHGRPNTLAVDHKAAVDATTRYPRSVRSPLEAKRVLKSGIHSRKIGDRVAKGPWAGMPIYTLTLEERATCPQTCPHWLDCYGNKMPFAHRFQAGYALQHRLTTELAALNAKHRDGFVVRLHVLGDFYSIEYVDFWRRSLDRCPGLYVFGYTSWRPGTEIGDAVAALRDARWDRFAVRTSDMAGEKGVTTFYGDARGLTGDGIVCPAQTGDTDCCGTCGLCWGTQQPIVFLAH